MRTRMWASLFVFMAVVVTAQAEDFRIDTEIFLDDQKEPVFETLTIFHRGVVYDFLRTGVEEVTLFDRERQRLVLMDTRRQVKTVLPMDSIISSMAELKVQLSSEHGKFLLGESAELGEDEQGWIKLANERITYRAKCIPPDDKTAALEYQEFADWYARLNAMRPHNLPPFLRIKLNSEIAKKGLMPKTVERTIAENRMLSSKQQVVRSEHLANWRLSHSDRRLIDRANAALANFREVSFREYVQPDSPGLAGARRD